MQLLIYLSSVLINAIPALRVSHLYLIVPLEICHCPCLSLLLFINGHSVCLLGSTSILCKRQTWQAIAMKTFLIPWLLLLVLSFLATTSMAGSRRMLTEEGYSAVAPPAETPKRSLDGETEPDPNNHHAIPRPSFGHGDKQPKWAF